MGWSQDPGPPNGGGSPPLFYYRKTVMKTVSLVILLMDRSISPDSNEHPASHAGPLIRYVKSFHCKLF